ncbi:sodium channel protein type 1 subunit alpha-like [Argiope bruennichi]|uniref:sodium channel protein type 1 subunit alpha-like n=1 Tax=Argiope bruennichi TaxID=94029 RepID=UPI0024955E76|nr:sodium channel protein type 1 subunit alpha-like [Argiope bruennichi]
MASSGVVGNEEWMSAQILKATGPLSSIFFVPVIFFGSFCLLNLMLIVVISTYEAMVSAYEAKYQKVSAYTYHTYFQFDISQLSLYPLPTNRETLRKVFRERDDLLSHREAVQQTWEMLKNLMNLSQSIQQKIEKKHAQNRVIFIPKSARNIQNERQTILNRWINFTEKVKAISESSPFRWFILLTVCINAIFLASEHANMSPKVGEILDIGNMLNLLKFQKAWFPLQRISTVIVNSLGRIVRLIIVVFLLIFVFAIIGNRVLGPLYPYTTTLRWSFRTFEESLFMVLWIFTGEWINSLWNCMHESSNSVLCPIIFITYYLIGNLVIISVFAALLLRSFSDLGIQRRFPFFPEKKFNFKRYSKYVWKYIPAFFHKKEKSNINDYGDKKNSGISSKRTSDEFYSETKQKNKLQLVKKFIQSYKFEVIVNIIIISSCLVMVLHNTKNEEDYEMNQYITIFNIIFTVLFILEMLLRWFGNGIVNYFTSAWTLFDFFIIVVSVVQDLYLYLSQTRHMVNSLTVFRSLRCLRLLYRWHDIKLIIGALVLSIPGIFHTLLVVMVIWLPFAIMGIHFFAGNFYRCVDRNNQPIEEQAMNKSECIKNGYFWSNSVFNFDHIGNSYLSLFQLAMFTGWDSLVRLMVDFRGPDLAPEKDYKKEYYIFAVIFVFVGGFFSLNLFLGVVVNTFKYMRKEMEGGDIEILLTKTQKVYYRAMIKFSRRSPSVLVEPPTDKFSQFFYIISTSWWFRLIIFVVICANATVVAIQFQAKLEFIAHIRKIWEAVR